MLKISLLLHTCYYEQIVKNILNYFVSNVKHERRCSYLFSKILISEMSIFTP